MAYALSKSYYDEKVKKAIRAHADYSEFAIVRSVLEQNNFVCWVAGGAVRDFLLGRKVADFDLVTDATTEQIVQLFPQAIGVGLSFGVVKLPLKNKNVFFDLATFRRESDYVDGRRPSHVDYATAEEDAGRRDFTVNGLFWDDKNGQVVDYVSGLEDLENKLLKCVGNPDVRFQEDHLRILRLARFAVQLHFTCDEKTLIAAMKRVSLLEKISGERIWAELQKLIQAVKWSEFKKFSLGMEIFKFIFPGFIIDDNKMDRLDRVNGFERFKFLYVLISGAEFGPLKTVLKTRIKVGNDELKWLDFINFCIENRDSLSEFEWAVQIEKNPPLISCLEFLSKINDFSPELFSKVSALATNAPEKVIDGNDLMGVVPKENMGTVLKKIRLLQYQQPLLSKLEILDWVRKNN